MRLNSFNGTTPEGSLWKKYSCSRRLLKTRAAEITALARATGSSGIGDGAATQSVNSAGAFTVPL
jgi:hypothetical protein